MKRNCEGQGRSHSKTCTPRNTFMRDKSSHPGLVQEWRWFRARANARVPAGVAGPSIRIFQKENYSESFNIFWDSTHCVSSRMREGHPARATGRSISFTKREVVVLQGPKAQETARAPGLSTRPSSRVQPKMTVLFSLHSKYYFNLQRWCLQKLV